MSSQSLGYADSLLDYQRLEQLILDSAGSYRNATPFPHIVIEDLLSPELVDFLLQRIPEPQLAKEQGAADYLQMDDGSIAQAGKQWVSRELSVDVAFRRLYWELNSGPFVRFLQQLTGIPRLLPDPYLLGGGIHQTLPGGFLRVHADFNQHPDLQLARRLNVLIYLNKDWHDDYGGELELWSTDMSRCERSIAPLAGRCVIFNTTSTSYHGHPHPLTCPPGETRKSIALYYYSRAETTEQGHETLWQKLPEES
jgi:Rps23 Pro-64 3,4-dihydroxylase Tpa1-like proline 4-hydroxylase